MSYNPTQNLKCHLCGESYAEEDGHYKRECIASLEEALHAANDEVSRLSALYLQAKKEYGIISATIKGMNTKVSLSKCNNCGYEWLPRTTPPARCPKCKSKYIKADLNASIEAGVREIYNRYSPSWQHTRNQPGSKF